MQSFKPFNFGLCDYKDSKMTRLSTSEHNILTIKEHFPEPIVSVGNAMHGHVADTLRNTSSLPSPTHESPSSCRTLISPNAKEGITTGLEVLLGMDNSNSSILISEEGLNNMKFIYDLEPSELSPQQTDDSPKDGEISIDSSALLTIDERVARALDPSEEHPLDSVDVDRLRFWATDEGLRYQIEQVQIQTSYEEQRVTADERLLDPENSDLKERLAGIIFKPATGKDRRRRAMFVVSTPGIHKCHHLTASTIDRACAIKRLHIRLLEAAKKKAEAEAIKNENKAAKKKAEAEAIKKENKAAKKKAEAEAIKKENKAAKKKAEAEAIKKENKAAKKKAEAEAIKKENKAAKKKAEAEAIKKEVEAMKKKAEALKKQNEAVKKKARAMKKENDAVKKEIQATKKKAEAIKKEIEATKKADTASSTTSSDSSHPRGKKRWRSCRLEGDGAMMEEMAIAVQQSRKKFREEAAKRQMAMDGNFDQYLENRCSTGAFD